MTEQASFFAAPVWLDTVDSTNNELRRRLAAGTAAHGAVLAARSQTAGRGRMGNSWHAAPDTGLLFSFVWQGRVALADAGSLPMACALAACNVLEALGVPCSCKWPNDVMTPEGKICGILTESLPAPSDEVCLIIGMGINVAPDPGLAALVAAPAASVARWCQPPPAPNNLLLRLLPALEHQITRWHLAGFPGIEAEYRQRLWGLGREVRVRTRMGSKMGRIHGVGKNGEVHLLMPDNSVQSVVSVTSLEFE